MNHRILCDIAMLLSCVQGAAMEVPEDKLLSDWETIDFKTYAWNPLLRFMPHDTTKADNKESPLCTSTQVVLDLSNKGIYNLAALHILLYRIHPYDVYGIDLSGNHISSFSIKALRETFHNLCYIDLRKNEIRRVSHKNLAGLSLNCALLLSENKITHVDTDSYPIFKELVAGQRATISINSVPLNKTEALAITPWERLKKYSGALDLSDNPLSTTTITTFNEAMEEIQRVPWYQKITRNPLKPAPLRWGFEIIMNDHTSNAPKP